MHIDSIATTERVPTRRTLGARPELEAVLALQPRPMTSRQVLRAGVVELIELLDSGDIALEVAAIVALFAPADQRAILVAMDGLSAREQGELVRLLLAQEGRS